MMKMTKQPASSGFARWMSLTQKIIAGVDIGGTKTRIMACLGERTIADEVLVTRAGASVRWRPTPRRWPASSPNLWWCRANCLAVGAHGCDTGEQCLRFQALLATRTGGAVQVVNDAELMVPAAGHVDGIGVVSSTGSIAVARTAEARCWPPAAGAGSSGTKAARRPCARGGQGHPPHTLRPWRGGATCRWRR